MGICPSIGAAGTPAYEAAWRHAVEVGGGWGVVPQHCHPSSTGVLVIASKMIIVIIYIFVFFFSLWMLATPQIGGFALVYVCMFLVFKNHLFLVS